MFSFRASVVLRSGIKHRGLATAAPSFRIPLIDFSRFKSGSPQDKKNAALEIVNGFKESGFIYLSGHGIPAPTIDKAFAKSAEFFAMPSEVKDSLAWEDPRSNRGYVKIGRERVTQATDAAEIAALREKAPDFKETMEIGRDWDSVWKNQWPKAGDAPGFKDFMLEFFETCHQLHVHVMRAIALGLELEEGFFDNKISEQSHNLRLLSYPPIKRALLDNEGQARAGAHSDYGTLTLLFQDSVGGLEAQNPHTGQFIPAAPIPGTIVVNVGDLLARWSNDVLRSTLHRVVAPAAKPLNAHEAITPARQSIAFFCNPNFTAEISCLPNCGKEKYPPLVVPGGITWAALFNGSLWSESSIAQPLMRPMSLFTTIKSRSASRYYATQGTRRSYKPKPLLGRYTDVVPLDLLRVQPGLNVRLREYETQCAKGRYAYDLKLQNGKVLPATGQNFMGPNGCSLRPSLSPMTQEIVRNFTVLGADMKIFLLKEGTRLPSLLTILHEHTDHYALQCTRPMSLDELNWELIDFMHENGRQMNQSQLEEEFPYIPF